MFSYEEYPVEGKPALFIKKLWSLNNMANALPVSGKSVLPNGCFNIAFINGNGLQVTHRGIEMLLQRGVYFCGQMTEALSVVIEPYTSATMVQLYPWTPVHFTAANLSRFTDQIVSSSEAGLNVLHRLSDIQNLTPSHIFRCVKAVFNHLLHFSPASAAVLRATRLILEAHGDITISALAEDLHCSVRHLQKLFKAHVGLSPKELAVIIKLRDTVDDLAYSSADYDTLTQLALAHQFYDQAHFNNTFQNIIGVSPNRFHIPDYFLSWKK